MNKSLEEMRAFVEKEAGKEIVAGLSDGFFRHTYRAMKDYGMDLSDSDRWAWLNTLFGYDIGADRALGIIRWYDEQGMDVIELNMADTVTVESF